MKFFGALVAVSIIPVACIVGTVYLIMHDKDGWGWLIFIAFIASGASITTSNSKDETKP